MKVDSVIVIFGCRHKKEFLARTYVAINFAARKGINPVFIFTGCDSPPPKEAISMFGMFGANRIIWENVSRDTQENVRNTLEEIRRRWLDKFTVYFISSWYHVPKIKLFLKREGARLSRFGFIRSYNGIQLINVVIEPFAFLAAYLRINRWPMVTFIKRCIGYSV